MAEMDSTLGEVLRVRKLRGSVRTAQRVLLYAIPVIGVIYILDIPGYAHMSFPEGQYLGVFLAFILGSIFLAVPPTDKADRDRVPWYDLLLAALGLIVGLYITTRYDEILMRAGEPTIDRLILAAITVLLVLEANRRVAGWVLPAIGATFILYAAYAEFVPGGFAGSSVSWPQLLNYMYIDTNALLGLPVTATATVVLAFIFFGQILYATGAGDFFTEFASVTLGRFRGGGAKISVVASSLFGTISGSAMSNVVVDGVFTINLMKRTGYKPWTAAAVEAVASTGGQIMPPVMGAAAFLIAQFLAIPYREVAIAAALPAVMYYICLYVQIDLEAAREGLRGANVSEMPTISLRRVLLRGWRFAVSFIVLIVVLFFVGLPEAKAGIVAGILAIILGFCQSDLRRNVRWILNSLQLTSRVLVDVGVVCALSGFIVGAMQVSGLSFILSSALINLSGGNIVVLLVLTAAIALILGMGMPTTAVYVLLAVLVAPALVQLGVQALAAHLFVFYFGVLSAITPPVCLAALVAAAIAQTSFWRTGFEAMRLAGVAYIVPFMFVASPTLLLRGSLEDIVPAVATAIVGTILLGMALVGYFVRNLGWLKRVVIGLCGIALILPPKLEGLLYVGWTVNLAGLIAVAPLLFYEWQHRPSRVGKKPAKAAA